MKSNDDTLDAEGLRASIVAQNAKRTAESNVLQLFDLFLPFQHVKFWIIKHAYVEKVWPNDWFIPSLVRGVISPMKLVLNFLMSVFRALVCIRFIITIKIIIICSQYIFLTR